MQIKVNNIILSKEQSFPIIDNPNISIIIAGAGSGKTLTIVGKIKYMLENNLVNQNEICAITYTNKAVESLKNKIKEATNKDIDVYTFHKLSLNILDKSNINYSIAPSNLLESIIDEFFQTKAFGNNYLLNYIYKYFNINIFRNNREYEKILNSKKYNNLKRLIISFISYMNSNDLLLKFTKLIKHEYKKDLLIIIYTIYTIYINELNSSNEIDFDKMIELATKVVKENKVILPYKLIIIDEFQDTSRLRFNLIKEIVNKNNSRLCVVGDDYQSIYRFQGCDLSLFINFNKEYKNSKTYFLNETYRNSQELINMAGNFIQKNPYQIRKKLISKKRLNNPIIIVYYFIQESILLKIIKKLPLDKEILILGRNNFDIKSYLNNYKLDNSKLTIKNDKHNLKYMTIHSSKGLESDIVIILNVKDDIYGIPSKIKDDKILSLLKTKELYKYEEERRLFYVALTRTKSIVYLLTPIFKKSIFIKEIKKTKNIIYF
ncbi:MAG: UvrD-helicase domain-containing protein [Bacilli bacterium]|nr:UvrD-helicase domain-containing protein [Bacilli bacterium]